MNARFVEGVLLRCVVLSFAVLLFWFVAFLVCGPWAYGVHSTMFDISPHDFEMINYVGMAVVKIFAVLVFLVPYVAMRLTPKDPKSLA